MKIRSGIGRGGRKRYESLIPPVWNIGGDKKEEIFVLKLYRIIDKIYFEVPNGSIGN